MCIRDRHLPARRCMAKASRRPAACSEDSLAASNRELRWMGCTSADAGLSLPSTSITQCANAADATISSAAFGAIPSKIAHGALPPLRATVRIALHAAHCFFVSRRYRRSVQQPLAPDQRQLRLPGLKDTRLYVDKLPYTGLCVRDPLRRFNPHRRTADPG